MTLPSVLLALAGLLAIVGLAQPLAARARLPFAIVLAAIGVVIAAVLTFLLTTTLTDAFNGLAEMILRLPLSSGVFINVFLPLLLFQTALTLDVNRMFEDAAPILLLAVVAVIAATVVVGLALQPVSGLPLVVCLLLGSIVATTDPSAVVAIFRDLGAPSRLTRLVEGESLLNDAAAIAIFNILLTLLLAGGDPDIGSGIAEFVTSFAGGAVVGVLLARVMVAALPFMHDDRTAQATLTLALPYIAFIVCDDYLGVSGVVASVTAGLTMRLFGRRRMSPDTWAYIEGLWEQIVFWAGSMVFILAAILVPRLLINISWTDLGLILVVAASTLASRAIVLFILMPMLTAARIAQPVSDRFRLVIVWGGLRGAVTLALALAVTENPLVPAEVKEFVAILATGFALVTLFFNGLTLRPLIRILGIDRLSAVDMALRRQVLALALGSVRDRVAATAGEYEIGPDVSAHALALYQSRTADVPDQAGELGELSERQRLTIGLVALTNRESELVLDHQRQQTVSARIVEVLLIHVERIAEGSRLGGRIEYNRAARRLVAFPLSFRIAHRLHWHLRLDRFLMRGLADRFELLLVSALVLRQLTPFIDTKLTPMLGARVAELLREIVASRIAATRKSLDALRLQYPDYAEALERRFLIQTAVRLERSQYDTLFAERLIGRELHSVLTRDLAAAKTVLTERPRLDLGLNTAELVGRFDMFAGLPPESIDRICGLFVARFAIPGERIIRRGEAGDAVYFISSGAVEVALPGSPVRLGRGDFFGEMALLHGRRRMADVIALGYCQLLVLRAAEFQRFLEMNPDLSAQFDRVVKARIAMNEQVQPDGGDQS